MVAEGKTSKEIAICSIFASRPCRSYRKTMMKKLGINNVAGLTQLALSSADPVWRPTRALAP
jgi:DNA-binding CsgD family transcriptional regulator